LVASLCAPDEVSLVHGRSAVGGLFLPARWLMAHRPGFGFPVVQGTASGPRINTRPGASR
jgi:hypothetical protein